MEQKILQPYQQLEAAWADWTGTSNVVACSSGTAALHLALETLQLPQGSKVLVPEFTMVACARAVTLAGLVPIFVDCTSELLIDPDLIDLAAAEFQNVLAIMPVHVYGRRCDMGAISILARKYGLKIVEDLAEAHGVNPHPDTDAACWSFYRNKIVAGEEGGAIAYKEAKRASLARSLRCQGFNNEVHDFMHLPRGHNYRLANSLAKLIIRSLDVVNNRLIKRNSNVRLYDEACPDEWKMPPRDAPWVYDLRLPAKEADTLPRVVRALQGAGVEARHSFKPMSWQPEYVGHRLVTNAPTRYSTQAARAATTVLYLPVDGYLTPEDAAEHMKIIKDTLS